MRGKKTCEIWLDV